MVASEPIDPDTSITQQMSRAARAIPGLVPSLDLAAAADGLAGGTTEKRTCFCSESVERARVHPGLSARESDSLGAMVLVSSATEGAAVAVEARESVEGATMSLICIEKRLRLCLPDQGYIARPMTTRHSTAQFRVRLCRVHGTVAGHSRKEIQW